MFCESTSYAPLTLTRRTLISNAATLAAASTLTGCCLHHGTNTLQAVGLSPLANTSQSGLLIDSHSHVFNGSDLPVKEFISRIVLAQFGIPDALKQVVGDLFRLFASPAPCGYQELAYLKQLSDRSGKINHFTEYKTVSQKAYTRTQRAVEKALLRMKTPQSSAVAAPSNAAAVQPMLAAQSAATALATPAMRAILQAPESTYDLYVQLIRESFAPASYDDHLNLQVRNLTAVNQFEAARVDLFARPLHAPCNVRPPASFNVPGLIQYLVTNDLYRIVEIQKYLQTFTSPSAGNRNVDLVVAHMVDYDWWLAAGKPTTTSLQTQVDVMAEISIYTKGQVHAFAPFDPLREIAHRAAHHAAKGLDFSSLAFVQNAVRNRGCLGVKLYPPMGFGASGNAQQEKDNPDFWKQGKTLPPWVTSGPISFCDGTSAPFGQRLDQVMDDLFVWCANEGVPVMAHSSTSNGPNPDFEDLATAAHWAPVVSKYKNLRVNFGHLGHFTAFPQAREIPCSSASLIDLFAADNHVYGDAGFDSEIMPDGGLELVEQRYALGAVLPLFDRRMMYGTDWNLLLTAGDVHEYQKRFQAVAEGLPTATDVVDGHSVRDRLLGWNAAEFLGLEKGKPCRVRLEKFYANNGLDIKKTPPDWMIKVDQC